MLLKQLIRENVCHYKITQILMDFAKFTVVCAAQSTVVSVIFVVAVNQRFLKASRSTSTSGAF